MARWRVLVWVALVAVIVAFLYAVRSILLPFVLAWLIAVILEPVVRKLRLRGFSRRTAVVTITLAFFVLSGAFLVYAIPRVNGQLGEFQGSVQTLTNKLAEENANDNFFLRWNPAIRAKPPGPVGWVDGAFQEAAPALRRFGLPDNRREFVSQYIEPRRNELANIVTNFFNGFLSLIGGAASQLFLLLFTPVFVFMILLDLERFRSRWTSWVPPSIRSETVSIIADIGDVFKRYLRGMLTAVGIYMLLMSLLFSILGVPYAILLGILAGALYLVPYLGPAMNALTIFVVTGFSGQSGDWLMHMGSPWAFAGLVAAIYLVFHFTFDTLVYPNLVGKAVDLHPLVSMFVVFSGGALFGLPGMLISFPLAGSIKVVLVRLLRLTTKAPTDGLGLPATPVRHR
ncbi:MAG TPA: AI-2E family transporter [Fimbriimonadaceae bacterium]|nr:AI-2E family transporter [Fimbriimonadaceae bacterium]